MNDRHTLIIIGGVVVFVLLTVKFCYRIYRIWH